MPPVIYSVLLILAGSVGGVPDTLRVEAFTPAAGMVIGAILLLAVGCSLSRWLGVSSDLRIGPLQIVLGQLGLLLYLYLRSTISHLCHLSLGVELPLYDFEILAVSGAALLWLVRSQAHQGWSYDWPLLFCCMVHVFLVAQRELPREIMFSGDPDQHLFWAHQLRVLGTVPFDQSELGPEGFGYPAGFAAVVRIWSCLSLTSAENVLQVQPVLQTLLGLLLMAQWASRSHKQSLFAAAFIGAGYWCLAPYGLSSHQFEMHGSGRISSLGLLALFIVLAELYTRHSSNRLLATLGVNGAVLVLMNPVHLFFPVAIVTILLCCKGWHQGCRAALKQGTWATVCGAVTILSDPYYWNRLFSPERNFRMEVASHGGAPFRLEEFASRWGEEFLRLGTLAEGGLTDLFHTPWLLLGGSAGLLALANLFASPEQRSQIKALWIGTLLVPIVLFVLLLPAFQAVADRGDLYMLSPYYNHHTGQILYLAGWGGLLLLLSRIFSGTLSRVRALVVILLLAVILAESSSIRGSLVSANLTPRFNMCGMLGCVRDEDRQVLAFIANHFRTYEQRVAEGVLQRRELPRVLITNYVWDLGQERWITPTGASRLLAVSGTFPVAFYYFQGSRQFTASRYEKNVCRRFNREWLRRQRIGYLFVPVDADAVCLAGRESLRNDPKRVLFASGSAFFARIDAEQE